ncbi:hypothetical protein WALSEDRAFT_42329 [Wallemia mellicola CBS 633.66]|uniref:DUF1783-domain-containing protein n=1 Tax=Wallemia mellicola (strain ATCC MYA-4683 / CBS 633.66) TaxID=671144 RepID=I4YJM1_WALMC|nr:hypothetical protein WALSEDRAFT_42329 [Wallemia mellicola CBS 633.66]EIM24163.1 hypothetical protein WALSEDRAFT_42329 [Wallemia mellicola CBS 633.66]|eukprot:XP_006955984.1 hypothetical protein WALSEDRAFT_42329 [Wallemia mellicola CBS 633.66]
MLKYQRFNRELPKNKNYYKQLSLLLSFSCLSWFGFIKYSNNQERLNSSIVKELIRQSKFHPTTRDVLGRDIRLYPNHWFLLGGLLGNTYVNGEISMMKGKIDISLDLKGSIDQGKIYFTSIRNSKHEKFQILRFKLIDNHNNHYNLIQDSSIKDFEQID